MQQIKMRFLRILRKNRIFLTERNLSYPTHFFYYSCSQNYIGLPIYAHTPIREHGLIEKVLSEYNMHTFQD